MSVVISLTIVIPGTESEALDHVAAFMEATNGRILDRSMAVVPDLSTHVVVAPSAALRVVSTTPVLQWKPFQDLCRRHSVSVTALCMFLAVIGIVVEWAYGFSHHGDAFSPSFLYAAGHSMIGVGFGVQVLCFNRQKMRLVLETFTFWFLSVTFMICMACQALLVRMLFNVPAYVAILFPAFSMVPLCAFVFGQDASPFSLRQKSAVILSTLISNLLSILVQQPWAIRSFMSPGYYSEVTTVHEFLFLHTTLQSLIISSSWTIFIFTCKLGFFCLWKKKPYILLNGYLKDLPIEDQENAQMQ